MVEVRPRRIGQADRAGFAGFVEDCREKVPPSVPIPRPDGVGPSLGIDHRSRLVQIALDARRGPRSAPPPVGPPFRDHQAVTGSVPGLPRHHYAAVFAAGDCGKIVLGRVGTQSYGVRRPLDVDAPSAEVPRSAHAQFRRHEGEVAQRGRYFDRGGGGPSRGDEHPFVPCHHEHRPRPPGCSRVPRVRQRQEAPVTVSPGSKSTGRTSRIPSGPGVRIRPSHRTFGPIRA